MSLRWRLPTLMLAILSSLSMGGITIFGGSSFLFRSPSGEEKCCHSSGKIHR